MPDEGNAEERLRVEGTNDEDESIVFFAGAVEFVADVDANGAPPDFSCMIEGPGGGIINVLFVPVPAVEILLHTMARVYHVRVGREIARCNFMSCTLDAMRSKPKGPRRGTRLGAKHESAATPKAAGAQKLMEDATERKLTLNVRRIPHKMYVV